MVLQSAISRLSPRPSSRQRNGPGSTSSSSTLVEALRTNPFRTASKESLPGLENHDKVHELRKLNADLQTLANLFPDIKVEVLRELLTRFDGNSRLEISAEQLWKYKAEWVKGRYVVPPRDSEEAIPRETLFKSLEYVSAVRKTLALEFRALSRSAIDAVLAEVNSSYSHARPILHDLSNKTWRATFSSLFRKRKPDDEPPSCLFVNRRFDHFAPRLDVTGSPELDDELIRLFIEPFLRQKCASREKSDLEFARTINQQEAEEANALYECEVCYGESTFETISICSTGDHVICYDCIRRTMHEALFGQGWAKSISPAYGSLKCVAPSATDVCEGSVPQDLVQQAILSDTAGKETWWKFEERLAIESLHKSRIELACCPFCSYAEAEQVYDVKENHKYTWHLKRGNTLTTVVALTVLVNLLPLLLLLLIPAYCLFSCLPTNIFHQSLCNISIRTRSTRFICQNGRCKRVSCLKCQKAWHDPHTCHEPLLVSLRTTVEAARTAAVKRTCPRCGTSFVKSSGCNKLTCVCGYSMCYICRKNIGRNGEGAGGGGEGYRHFCEHFRPTPGKACTECQKCDLYQTEDEDALVRLAGEEAEREWRIREGMVGVAGLDEVAGNGDGFSRSWYRFLYENWTWQDGVDWVVDRLVLVDA